MNSIIKRETGSSLTRDSLPSINLKRDNSLNNIKKIGPIKALGKQQF